MPWEIMAAMEKIVIDGKSSFSRSESISKNVNWLSLIIPNDAKLVHDQLEDFKASEFIPHSLTHSTQFSDFHTDRYQSSIEWIEKYEHAVISNGPFYLEGYSPDSRTITIKSFDSADYPLKQGIWKEFEDIEFPTIEYVNLNEVIQKGIKLDIPIKTKNSTEIHYFLSNSQGEIVTSGMKNVYDNNVTVTIESDEMEDLPLGPNTLKIFAGSDTVLRPYEFSMSFLVVEPGTQLPEYTIHNEFLDTQDTDYTILIVTIFLIIIGIIIFLIKKKHG